MIQLCPVSFTSDVRRESRDAGNGSAHMPRLPSRSLETRYRGEHDIETYQVSIEVEYILHFTVFHSITFDD